MSHIIFCRVDWRELDLLVGIRMGMHLRTPLLTLKPRLAHNTRQRAMAHHPPKAKRVRSQFSVQFSDVSRCGTVQYCLILPFSLSQRKAHSSVPRLNPACCLLMALGTNSHPSLSLSRTQLSRSQGGSTARSRRQKRNWRSFRCVRRPLASCNCRMTESFLLFI